MSRIRLPPIGFWSYARQDDELSQGKLSNLRYQLMHELQQQYGRDRIQLFQDISTIPHGAAWENEISTALGETTFFIAIITPNFVQSEWCCREVAVFLERQAQLFALYPDLSHRSRIFPIHFIDIEHVDPSDAEVLDALKALQWFDFRRFRHRNYDDQAVREALSEFAGSMRVMLHAKIEPPPSAEEAELARRQAEQAAEARRQEEEARAAEAAREADLARRQAHQAAEARRLDEEARAEAAKAERLERAAARRKRVRAWFDEARRPLSLAILVTVVFAGILAWQWGTTAAAPSVAYESPIKAAQAAPAEPLPPPSPRTASPGSSRNQIPVPSPPTATRPPVVVSTPPPGVAPARGANNARNPPSPNLRFIGEEQYEAGGKEWVRYRFDVLNRSGYPSDMFVASPALPPCGLNTNSSRSWVTFFDRSGTRLYAFCALGSPADLQSIWFSKEEGVAPPPFVYIEITDRLTGRIYRSNLAETGR